MRSHATPTRGLGLVLIFPLNLIVVSKERMVSVVLRVRAHAVFLVTAAEHQLAVRVVNITPVCSQSAIARCAALGIPGRMARVWNACWLDFALCQAAHAGWPA